MVVNDSCFKVRKTTSDSWLKLFIHLLMLLFVDQILIDSHFDNGWNCRGQFGHWDF